VVSRTEPRHGNVTRPLEPRAQVRAGDLRPARPACWGAHAARLAQMSFAFDFARHFFQPRGIGRTADQRAQMGGNRRLTGWLCLAVSLQLGPSAAAQGTGGHVSSSFRIPRVSLERASYGLVAGSLGSRAKTGKEGRPPQRTVTRRCYPLAEARRPCWPSSCPAAGRQAARLCRRLFAAARRSSRCP
jgi:hypothetical protein